MDSTNWVSVKDRLPNGATRDVKGDDSKNGTKYLGILSNGQMAVVKFNYEYWINPNEINYLNGYHWSTEQNGDDWDETITHWHELPELP